MRRARLLAILLPALLLLVGPARVSASGHLVRITEALEPAVLTIAPGDTVTWRNDDVERHRVRSTAGPAEFDSGDLDPGASFTVTLSQVGTYTYRDERNKELDRYWGTVVVATAPPSPTPTAPPSGGGGGSVATPAPTPTPAAVTIGMAGRTFSPSAVTIAAGGTVTWRNDDDRDHTATSTSGAFDSGRLAPGATFRKTFEAPGSFSFLCLIHPDMTGTVTVTGSTTSGGGGTAATTPPATAAPTTPATTTATPPPAPIASGTVRIVDLAFEPGELTVLVGATVTWRNAGIAPHTVTSTGRLFDSGVIDAGGRFSRTFRVTGRFDYLCTIHPSMRGSIVVRAANDPPPAPGTAAPPSPTPTALQSAAPPSESPPSAVSSTAAPPGATADPASGNQQPAAPGSGPGPGAAGASAAAIRAAEIVSTVIALGLIVGATLVGAGLLLGVVRRAEGSAAG